MGLSERTLYADCQVSAQAEPHTFSKRVLMGTLSLFISEPLATEVQHSTHPEAALTMLAFACVGAVAHSRTIRKVSVLGFVVTPSEGIDVCFSGQRER